MFKNKRQPELLIGLDIGSTAVRVAAAQLVPSDGGKPKIQLIAVAEAPSVGVHKGVVSSIEEVVSSISNVLEETERLIGAPIENVWVGITGSHIMLQASKGVVAVAKADGDISTEDVRRVIDAAQMIASPLNYEVLHVMPRRFAVDGQTGIKSPVGMTGIRLEADTQIVYGLSSHLKNITKAVYRTGVDIDDLIVSIFGIGDMVATDRQKEMGVAVVDIGGSTTSMAVYEEGEVIHMAVLPIGSAHITNDIALGLRNSIEIAERLKLEYGSCAPSVLSKKEIIDLESVGSPVSEAVSLHYLIEIINARVVEILEKVNKELITIKRAGLLPSGVIFTGGGAKIPGLVDVAKETLRLPATLGYPLDLESVTDKAHDVSFATAIGLAVWGGRANNSGTERRGSVFTNAGGKMATQWRKIFKLFIP